MLLIDTERLTIRQFTLDDAAFTLGLLNQPSFLEFIGDRGVRDLDTAVRYITNGPLLSYQQHGYGLMVVTRKPDGLPAGICGLLKRATLEHPDIGYAFLPEFWGQGLAEEAARAVLRHAREGLGIGTIVAVVSPGNSASTRLLHKLGFAFERPVRLTPDAAEIEMYTSSQ